MAYEKQTFADNNVLHAHHLNHMEAGIEKNSEDIEVNAFNIGVLNTVDLTTEGDKLFLKTALGKIGEGVSLGGAIEEANKYTDEKIASLVDSAPETLDTLNEIAVALKDNQNVASALTKEIGQKADKAYVDSELEPVNHALNLVAENLETTYNQLGQKANQADLDNVSGDVETLAGEVDAVANRLDGVSNQLGQYATKTELSAKADQTEVDGLNQAMDSVVENFAQAFSRISDLEETAEGLHEVATSGSYNDLTDKPSIPSVAGLASTTYVDTKVATKANQTDVDGINQSLDSVAENIGTIYKQLEGKATTTYVDTKIADLVGAAPEELDTLKELSDALNGDDDFAANVLNKIGQKADKSVVEALDKDMDEVVKEIAEVYTELSKKANDADIKTVAKTGSYNDLSNKPTIPSISGLATTSYVDTKVAGKADQTEIEGINQALDLIAENTADIYTQLGQKANDADLKAVAKSGSYNDLTNKPTIPTKTSQLTNNSGFATETYVNNKVAGIVDSSPEALNTLNELAAALGDNPNFSTDVLNLIGQKASQADLDNLSGDVENLTTEVGKKANTSSLHKVATSGSYNDLSYKPTIPTVNNATLTIQKNGSNVATFTANSSSNATANITVPTKTSELTNDSNYATTTQLATKLDKTTYEESKELALGSNGKVCLGKFGAYDTNITIEINSTTHTTYHATIVIHSQNVVANGTGGTVGCYVYDDADNHITPLISVFRPYGSASRQIEVYADLPGWSKNLVHVQGVAISTGGMTDVLTSVSAIPTAIDGKIKVTPVNVLTTNFASKTAVTAKADQADVDQLYTMYNDTYAELGKKANDADLKAVAKSGSYNDLTNKPTIPTVNNATLTIQKNGSNVATFTANSASNATANITVPTKTSDLQNDSGFVTSTNTGVQSIAGGLVVGGTSASAIGKGRIMVTGSTNPLLGVQAIDGNGNLLTPYYFQVSNDVMYIGPTSSKALAFDSNGNTAIPASLTVAGSITANGASVVTETRLQSVLGSYVNDIDALLGG